MMEIESQVLVREFNRRLRAALRGVPNHVRVEAALEVESHVQDVLSRGPSDLPEPERVARILSGFGSPEAYARALITQLPEEERLSVGGGLREILLAFSDLARGTGRLLVALAQNTAALAVAASRKLWQGATWAGEQTRQLIATSRKPARQILTYLRTGGRVAGSGLVRSGRMGQRLLGKGTRLAGRMLAGATRMGRRGLWHAGRLSRQSSHFAVQAVATAQLQGGRLFRFLGRTLRWLLRTAALAALVLVTLAAFALAAFAALAPDVTGWFVLMANREVARWLESLRAETVAWFSPAPATQLVAVGEWVLRGALATGVILTVLLGFIIWYGRRRRSAPAN